MIAHQLNQELFAFLKIQLAYNTEYKKFIFDNKWATEITKDYFDDTVAYFKDLVLQQLRIGKNNDLYLKDLLDLTGKQFDILAKYKTTDFNTISHLKILSDIDWLDKPNDEVIVDSPDFLEFKEFIKNNEEENQDTDLYFEKINLLYVLDLYKKAVYNLHYYIEEWILNLPYTDISKITPEFLASKRTKKLSTSFAKLDLALFFYILKQEKVFYMDIDEARNNHQINMFIEDNFTYWSIKEKRQKEIKSINKEFAGLNDKYNIEIQIRFIDDLISILKERKKKLQ